MIIGLVFRSSGPAGRFKNGSTVCIETNFIGITNNSASYRHFIVSDFFEQANQSGNRKKSIGDAVLGISPQDIGIHAIYPNDTSNQMLFSSIKNQNNVKNAIENGFSLQFYLDNLEFWAPVGEVVNGIAQIYTMHTFSVSYNDNRIFEVHVRSTNSTTLSSLENVQYAISFYPSGGDTRNRLNRFLHISFFENSIHSWILIVNIFEACTALAIVYYLLLIMKSEADPASNINQLDDFDFKSNQFEGCKILHGDVFRTPSKASYLTVLSSAGFQLIFGFFLFGMISAFTSVEKSRDYNPTILLITMAISSLVGGVITVIIGNSLNVLKWLRAIFSFVFLLALAWILLQVALRAFGYPVSLFSSLIFFGVFVMLALPLATFGGRCVNRKKYCIEPPCDVAMAPRTTPSMPWYLTNGFLMIVIGILSALPAIPELFYIVSAIWLHRYYYVWKHFVFALVLVVVISGCFTVIAVALRLQKENHRWQWFSFLAPASSAIFVFLYQLCYLFAKSTLSGFNQSAMFIVFSLFIACIVGLICGASGFVAATYFVWTLFDNLKLD